MSPIRHDALSPSERSASHHKLWTMIWLAVGGVGWLASWWDDLAFAFVLAICALAGIVRSMLAHRGGPHV